VAFVEWIGSAQSGYVAQRRLLREQRSDMVRCTQSMRFHLLTAGGSSWLEENGSSIHADSSVSPTHGEQEQSVWNGHFGCTCYHPIFVFDQFGDLERCVRRRFPRR
jgi:hypothetical protein